MIRISLFSSCLPSCYAAVTDEDFAIKSGSQAIAGKVRAVGGGVSLSTTCDLLAKSASFKGKQLRGRTRIKYSSPNFSQTFH
ncbi:MAG TPA: hypothetical protein VKR56_11515 [Candidatus Cybelea sp.]|nr:hypothetical protein [Candidatus Cybelea sp.]